MKRKLALKESKSVRNYNLDNMISSMEQDVIKEYNNYMRSHKKVNMEDFKYYFCWTIGKEMYYEETFHDFGTFDVDDFHVQVIMYDDIDSYGFVVGELCNKQKMLVVVLLSSKVLPDILNRNGKLFNTLTHEIRHGEELIKDILDTDLEMMKNTVIEFYGKEYNVEKFKNTDESMLLVTYFLTRTELKGYIQTIYGIFKRFFNTSNTDLLKDALVKLTYKLKKPLNFHRIYDLLVKQDNGKRPLLELFIDESKTFKIYFIEAREIMIDYSFFKKYVMDSISSHKKDIVEYTLWLKNMLDSQYFSRDDNKKKKHNDRYKSLMKKYISYGMTPEEAIRTYVENDYTKELYEIIHKDYIKFISAVVKNLIEYVSNFDKNEEVVSKLRKDYIKSIRK